MSKSKKESIKEQIAELQRRLRKVDDEESMRVGRLAQKAGLHEMDISDEEYSKVFEVLARRFQGQASQ